MTVEAAADLGRYHENIKILCAIALRRLPQMIDEATGLMVFHSQDDALGESIVSSGSSFRYSAAAALGLERAEQHGLASALDLERLYAAMSVAIEHVDNAGDLGLALWASARRARPLAERALAALVNNKERSRSRSNAMVHSSELAWVVTGLSEALAAGIGREREVRTMLDRAFRQLLAHQGPSGLVSFAWPREALPARHIRRYMYESIGFFDAQAYTIVAALHRDAVVHDPEAREVARRIGEVLLSHQHPLGQWGWHYNVRTGGLIDVYPVYSVHQDGLAPMALIPLERETGLPTTSAVARGVGWLFGANELGERVVDGERDAIWRSIRRREQFRNVVHPLKLVTFASEAGAGDLGARLAARTVLEVDREIRPYHLGFCLYAFSELAASPSLAEPPPIALTRVPHVCDRLPPARVSNGG